MTKETIESTGFAMTGNRLVWLDFLKGLAITAVVANHVFNIGVPICPSNWVCQLSFFSVSLFVLCGGVSVSMSLGKCDEAGSRWKKVRSRVMSLLGYYTIALLLTDLLNRRFDLGGFLSSWISFPAQFYFVLFFCELLLVAPIVYGVLFKYRGKFILSFVCLFGVMLFALLCMFFTSVPQIYGGGGVLLGGSYLFLFAIGCFFALNAKFSTVKTLSSIALLMMVMFVLSIAFKVISGGAHGLVWALNPPGLLRMSYALVMFVGFYTLLNIHNMHDFRVVSVFAWLGRHSLDIFLFHMIVQVVLVKLFPGFSGWTWGVACCVLICLGAVMIGKAVRLTVSCCKKFY